MKAQRDMKIERVKSVANNSYADFAFEGVKGVVQNFKINKDKNYVVRFSCNIEADLKRNWSSVAGVDGWLDIDSAIGAAQDEWNCKYSHRINRILEVGIGGYTDYHEQEIVTIDDYNEVIETLKEGIRFDESRQRYFNVHTWGLCAHYVTDIAEKSIDKIYDKYSDIDEDDIDEEVYNNEQNEIFFNLLDKYVDKKSGCYAEDNDTVTFNARKEIRIIREYKFSDDWYAYLIEVNEVTRPDF